MSRYDLPVTVAGPRRTRTGFRISPFAMTSLVYEPGRAGARGLRRSAHTSAPAIAAVVLGVGFVVALRKKPSAVSHEPSA